ncbi:MAG: trehalose-6-phosphate synthase [Phycisphaerales bacterium]|nr:trehalose-6-phosphate synthase [Phycisphaerales bacterium]
MKNLITRSPRSLRFGVLIAVIGGLATAVISWQQVAGERRTGLDDLERRAGVLAHRVSPTALQALDLPDDQVASAMADRLEGHSRLIGLAVCRPDGRVVASGPGVPEFEPAMREAVQQAVAQSGEAGSLTRGPGGPTHLFAVPLADPGQPARGVLVVLHDTVYLDDRLTRGMLRGAMWTVGVTALLLLFTAGGSWAMFERPLHKLAAWMRRLRFGNMQEAPPRGLAVSRLADESEHLAASFRASRQRERVEAEDTLRSERAWTRERLRAHAIDALRGQQLVVVSNREPYMHQMRDGRPQLVMPASGLVTALDPVLRACGGLWVAHGAGDADKQTANASGCIAVPPSDPRYTLRRVWISKDEEQGYYYGFSNEGLWPLCHLTHERPLFRASDWDHYVRANRRFADAVLEEIGNENAVVMVQDYQLALVPGMLKEKRPDLRVGIFWHIPWPNAEAFRICPYRVEILHGMLGADLIGFHLQQHCNNFLDTVDRMVEARLDWDRFAADLKGHTAVVRPFPISVQAWSEKDVATGDVLAEHIDLLKQQHGLTTPGLRIGVGVDRIDYTKGIAERFRAVDRFFDKHPEHRGRFTFVQLGAPSRTHIPRYRDLVNELEAMADAINWKYPSENGDWKPIRLLVDHHDAQTVHAFMQAAEVCIVSSLHDGMNLVAKEYVAAKGAAGEGEPGVLILSEFAGAARDLPEALIINPYDTEEFAAAINTAIVMDPKEKRQRMTRMRVRVEGNNIYRWAADFLGALAHTKDKPERAVVDRT